MLQLCFGDFPLDGDTRDVRFPHEKSLTSKQGGEILIYLCRIGWVGLKRECDEKHKAIAGLVTAYEIVGS